MDKEKLVIKLAEEFGISTIDIYQFVNTVFDSMQGAFVKGKSVNIAEFGKFILLNKKNEQGKTYRTISFSPVKKFASEINFRFNNLSNTPLLKESSLDNDLVVNEHSKIESNVSDNKTYPEMSDKDKYDNNLIRDEFPEDSSMESIEAFIKSKLDKSSSKETNENEMSEAIREFELPHTIIQLHNDITSDDEIENTAIEQSAKEIESQSNDSMNSDNDIESIIEHRKKLLEQSSPDFQSSHQNDITEQSQQESPEDTNEKNEVTEERENFEEFKNFEEERNAELSKIIEERNKIITDINIMVNETENNFNEPPPQIENSLPVIEEQVNSEPPEEEIFPRDMTEEYKPLQTEDNFDPIITSEDYPPPVNENEHFIENEFYHIETPIETPKKESSKPIMEPKSFEDVFVTKEEVTTNIESVKSEVPLIPEQKNTPPPPPVTGATYQERMQKRREMYEKKEGNSAKKALWIVSIIIILIIVIGLIYNYMANRSVPPPVNNNSEQTTGQKSNNEVKNTAPPVENKTKETSDQTSKEKETPKQDANEKSAPTTPSGEEQIADNDLKVVYIRTSEGFYVQTGSFKDKSVADSKAKEIKAGDKKVFVKDADLGEKGIYYRVRIGIFKTQEEAKGFASKLN